MFKRFLIAIAAAGILGISEGTTYYVDVNCRTNDYAKHDGKTLEMAKKTIQEGVNLCAASGDTVLVAPGDYNHGARLMSGGLPAWGKNVIMLESKQVTIRSTGGAAVTFITGQHGSHLNATTGVADGCGVDTNDFVRCIAAYGSKTEGSVIEGFTIRNGSCLYSASAPDAAYNAHHAGGISSHEGGRLYVTDCVLSNNVGGSDSAYYNVTFVRSKLVGHYLNGPSSSPSLASSCCFLNCYVAHNNCWQNGIVASGSTTKIVNCTFVDNNFSHQAYNTGTLICNSIINGRVNSLSTVASLVYGDNYDAAPYAIMAPPLDDYRVRLGSSAENMGDASHIREVTLPDGVERSLDIDGNQIAGSGTIAIGCCQTVVEPAAGGIFFNFYNQAQRFPYWRVDGGPLMHRDSYVIPGPGQVHAYHFEFISTNQSVCRAVYLFVTDRSTPDDTQYKNPVCGRASHAYCEGDGSLYMLPHLDSSHWICLNQIYSSTSVVYLDANASAAGADGSEERPFRTFKDAIESDLTGNLPVLLVKPGTYAEGDMVSPYEKSLNAKARIIPGSKTVFAVGLEGAEKTIIQGAPDPDSDTGCGDNAVRIAICGGTIGSTSGQGRVMLNGFTLTGGYSATAKTGDTENPVYWPYSGVILSEYTHTLARDCIISNNVGQYAAAGHWSIYDRCRILENRTVKDQTLLNNCYLSSCLVANNRCYQMTNPDSHCKSVNCTFVGQSRSSVHYGNGTEADRYNNVYLTGTTPSANGDLGGNIFWDFANVPQVLEARVMDPFVLKPEKGDARLFRDSPAVATGVAPVTNNDWFLLSCDLNGQPWRFEGGVGVSGASQSVVSNGLYLAATSGGVAADGEHGYFELESGESVTVRYEDGATRPVGSVSQNGVEQALPLEITAEEVEQTEGGMLVVANYTNVWYVDAVNGDDSNFGYATNNAFRTLQRAMENEQLIKSDRVVALPGVYEEGQMKHPGSKPAWSGYAYPNYTIDARAVVPDGVTLESLEGASVTTIRGQKATTPGSYVYLETDDIRGMGDDAMHAVILGTQSRVKGFTITEGFTRMPRNKGASPDGANHADPDFCGGGVTAYYNASKHARSNCWAEDCFFTNNAGFRGGGVMAVNCKNCVFVDNLACYGGGATSDSYVYGCLSRDNKQHYPYYDTAMDQYKYYGAGFFYGRLIHNSTMLDGFTLDTVGSTNVNSLCNNLILSRLSYASFKPHSLVNCAINNDTSGTVPLIYAAVSNANHCIYTVSDDLQLDAAGRPVYGANAAIDAGDQSLMGEALETDAGGIQRVYNNNLIDIGAMEFDWRQVYTADISNSKRISVAEAMPAVYESFDKTVRLPVATQVDTLWLGDGEKEQNFSCKARVSGNGTLIATLNGEELGRIEGTGEREFTFSNTLASNSLVFSYTGSDGYAELLATGRGGGSLIICR